MGLFSWETQDTNRSIPCSGSPRKTFPVTMIDDKGNKWIENDYEGYGVFGGKDFYELLAEMNDVSLSETGRLELRDCGIDLYYGAKAFLSPNLFEDGNSQWVNRAPEDCEFQGYFYDD